MLDTATNWGSGETFCLSCLCFYCPKILYHWEEFRNEHGFDEIPCCELAFCQTRAIIKSLKLAARLSHSESASPPGSKQSVCSLMSATKCQPSQLLLILTPFGITCHTFLQATKIATDSLPYHFKAKSRRHDISKNAFLEFSHSG